MKSQLTIHTSRTIMFNEFDKLMSFSMEANNYSEALQQNIFGKKSNSGVNKTAYYLKQLYGFNIKYPLFIALTYFWKICEPAERPLIAFIYAINHDKLLEESIGVLQQVKTGEKASIELFSETIEKTHPNQYSKNTRRSTAGNLASSWKQAGFIKGKIKNIRINPEISYRIACFAFLLAYLQGNRGDFIWNSLGVNALCLHEGKLRELAIECAKKDLMQYQYAGSVTAISFNHLLTKIGIDGTTY